MIFLNKIYKILKNLTLTSNTLKVKMLEAAKKLEFEVAEKLRDEIEKIKKL